MIIFPFVNKAVFRVMEQFLEVIVSPAASTLSVFGKTV